MKKPDNWDDDIDLDVMNENHARLNSIIDKFYFRSMPENPKVFSIIFSDSNFVSFIYTGLKMAGIKEPEQIVFCEYSREDKEKLISMGVVRESSLDTVLVIYTSNRNTLFINVLV
ncbi:MAG: hypothetical protein IKR04_04630 [Clostridia bacterium]|nr:hypothetical protein [Clostridia bacterium]